MMRSSRLAAVGALVLSTAACEAVTGARTYPAIGGTYWHGSEIPGFSFTLQFIGTIDIDDDGRDTPEFSGTYSIVRMVDGEERERLEGKIAGVVEEDGRITLRSADQEFSWEGSANGKAMVGFFVWHQALSGQGARGVFRAIRICCLP